MRLFQNLFQRVMRWSRHPHAAWYLGAVSFAEASCFIIPPDVLLVPMTLAKPRSAWSYAFLATLMSVLGSIVGYMIGLYAITLLEPWLQTWGYLTSYQQIIAWFQHYGVWMIIVAGLTPIPYKLFTIAAGALTLPFGVFILAASVGRSLRFFGVATLMRWGGASLEEKIETWSLRFAWPLMGLVVVIVTLIGAMKW